jgi:glycosidase
MFNKHVSEIATYLDQIVSNGYTHILISPVTICNLENGNAWWCRYQPLSYEIGSSAVGSYDEIKQFIKKCHDKKIKVICDIVINHMARFNMDITQDSLYEKFGLKQAIDSLKPGGTVGPKVTQYDLDKVNSRIYSADGFSYKWSGGDFYRYGNVADKINGYNITDWDDPNHYRTRWLLSLPDLNDYSENVKLNRRVFMNELAILGFAGLRVDAVKHVQPFAILDMVNQFINSAIGSDYTNVRNLPSFNPSDVLIICESLSNGRDYDVTFKSYMNELTKTKLPSSNFLFYDNINHYAFKDLFNNFKADSFDVNKSMNNQNLGKQALNYLCNHDIAHNMWANPDYFCNGYINTLLYGIMFLVDRMNVMVYNDDAFAYTRNPEFDQTIANKRLKSDNFLKEYDNKILGEIIKFSKVLDNVVNLKIERFKYGPNLIYKFNDLGLFMFSFTGCTFDVKATSSMNLGSFVDYTDSFSGKKLSNYVLPPYCSALFVKSVPIIETPTISKTCNFQVDLEVDIGGSNPKVLVKSANFID